MASITRQNGENRRPASKREFIVFVVAVPRPAPIANNTGGVATVVTCAFHLQHHPNALVATGVVQEGSSVSARTAGTGCGRVLRTSIA